MGIPSHPISIFDTNTLTNWAFQNFPDVKSEFSEIQPTLTPHRLDTDTTGLQMIALTKEAFALWRSRFAKKEIEKRYLAWCWGNPPRMEFEVNLGLAHSARDRRRMVAPSLGDAYEAPVLEAQSFVSVRKIVREHGIFLAQIRCFTGVTHQVRAHLSAMGFPLVGDSLYDGEATKRTTNPEHHLLRATELIVTGGEKYSVSTEAFCSLF